MADKEAAPIERSPTDSGVDPSLIQWFMTLTPSERLRVVQNYIRSVQKIRRANRDT
jgi:hypothetical protein